MDIENEIDRLVEKWHSINTRLSLQEYLQFSAKEYKQFVENNIIPDWFKEKILNSKK